jgi:hypothetical protein
MRETGGTFDREIPPSLIEQIKRRQLSRTNGPDLGVLGARIADANLGPVLHGK